MVEDVDGCPDRDAGGDVVAVQFDAPCQDFAGEGARFWGAEAEGLIDAGGEVGEVA